MSETRPAIEILLGPAGSGKSAVSLEQYRAAQGRALMLVPSETYAERMRGWLAGIDPDASGEDILPFAEVAKKLAAVVWNHPEAIRRSQQWIILESLVEQSVGDEDFFSRMRDVSGFVPALAQCLRELKLSGVHLDDLFDACRRLADDQEASGFDASSRVFSDPAFGRKIDEVAQLYQKYQSFLEDNGLLDEEEIYRLAADGAAKAKQGRLTPHLVVVDGFYRLSRLWRNLLAALANRGAKVVVTLPGEQSRPLLFATPLRTLDALRQEFECRETWLERAEMPNHPLRDLERHLFRLDTATPTAEQNRIAPAEAAAQPPVLLFDTPNRYSEVEMVARSLVRERNERGTSWSDCAVIVRSVPDYAPLLSGVLDRYGVPYAFRRGRPLTDNAAVRTLEAMLRIYLGDWQRDDFISFLKSDYVTVPGIGFDVVRVLARSQGVRERRSSWASLLPKLGEKNAQIAQLLEHLLDLQRAFPPGPEGCEKYGGAIHEAVSVFHLDEPEGRSDRAREDRAAVKSALEAVDQIVRHAKLADSGPVTLASFCRKVLSLWRSTHFQPIEPRDAVAIIEPYDAPQLRPAAVYLLGLTERVFPRRIKEDPFFRDEERDALRRVSAIHLEPQRARSDDERLLFYMAVTAPSERLLLSYPRSADDSDTLASFFIDEARTALEKGGHRLPAVVRTLADVAPTIEECVSERDRILALCALAADSEPNESLPEPVRDILDTRSRPPAPRLESETASSYSAPHRYSVTEVETYNQCPLKHFFRYGLRLRVEADGAGPADRGALHHDTLRRVMRTRLAGGAEGQTKLREDLVRQLVECMNERTIDARPHRRALMEHAVRGALDVCAEREERYGQLFSLSPTHFELAFGMEESEDEEGRRRDYDAASRTDPLVIPELDGPAIQLCGAIDRLDLADDGRTAMVLDYKMGKSAEWAEIREGKSIQIPLYLMAVEQVWGMIGAVGCYDSPRDNGRRRFFRKELVDLQAFQALPGVEDGRLAKPVGTDEFQEALGAACEAVRSAVRGMRAGRILPTPGEHCRWCDYLDVCRTAPDGLHDGEELSGGSPSVA